MKDNKHLEVKHRMLNRMMDLWGVKDAKKIDPVIDLFFDVFAYEFDKLYQEVKNSDTQLLHRLARILVSNKWSLPMPAHGLMTISSKYGDSCLLTPEDQFFNEKNIFGKENVNLFFSSLAQHKLTDAHVHSLVHNTNLLHQDEITEVQIKIFEKKHRIEDYCLWVGVNISPEQLENLNDLPLCVVTEDTSLLPFLKSAKAFDVRGKELSVKKISFNAENIEENHYFESISSYYEEQFLVVDIKGCEKEKKSLMSLFPDIDENVDADIEEQLFWIKLRLPEVFTREQIANTRIYTNTFPVVNRFLCYKQHSFLTNGKIFSIPIRKDTLFLNVNSINDNNGISYNNVLKSNDSKLDGTFSLYFGNIERFDTSSAKALVNKVFRLIREDGNAFAAMNPDAMNMYLKDLLTKLNEFEKHVGDVRNEDIKDQAFLLVTPHSNTTHSEIRYWLTNGILANGLGENAYLQQFNTEKFDATRLKFRTTTKGGIVRKNEQELIDNLRYGLLTRDRIVSRADVKSFIQQQIGKHIRELEIKDGARISTDEKKGIVRTTEVLIKTKKGALKEISLSGFALFLEKELKKRSISNTYYHITFN